MPARPPNLARQIANQQRAELHCLRCNARATLLAQLHGLDLVPEVTTAWTRLQLEDHCLNILIREFQTKVAQGKPTEAQNLIDQVHPEYLQRIIDKLTPLALEPLSDSE